MSNVGSNRDDNTGSDSSLSGLVWTIVPIAVTAAVYFVIFLVLRRSQRRWYAPRTYIGSLRESQRTPPLSNGFFGWIGQFWKIPDQYALQHQSLDAFLFLRFLRMTVVIPFVGCCITWPILFPINATGGGTQTQLNILSYSNVNRDTSKNRFYAHALVAWVFYGFVMYLIFRELVYFINLRQAFLISPLYSNRISSRTVLFTSVPDDYLNERTLRKVFGNSIKNIWITGNLDKLDKLVEERDKAAFKLEKSEVKLIKAANKARSQAIKKGGHGDKEANAPFDAESGSIAGRWIPKKKRPSHKTGKFGLYGKKVDSIDWCRSELARLIPEVETLQAEYRAGGAKNIPAVFIEFKTQAEAETAYQVLAHHSGLQMAPRYIGVTPGDVIWKSLKISWWQKVVRRYAVLAFITALIVFWAAPVAVVGVISNVNYLKTISFLTWLDKVPKIVMGAISGLLPSVALSILMSLVPVVMRLCAKLAGEPSYSRVELFTQNAYFVFQVVQVFLITTMTSSASAVAKQIVDKPSTATTLLSENLPKSSNFYISYFIVQGLTVASSVISQVVGFVIFTLLYKYLAGTPRALYNKWANLSAISWGSVMPVYTNIVVIAITYAGIAPLMLGFATIGMSLFYFAWRYNVLFVTDTKIDTRGLIYPRAIKQLFTGIYLAEVCMIGLFGATVAIGPLVLMVVFLVFTVLFHLSINEALNPLLYNLPQSLLAEEESRRAELEATTQVDSTGSSYKPATNGTTHDAVPRSTKKANFFVKFLKPWVHSDYFAMRELIPAHDSVEYLAEIEDNAYFPPSVNSRPPLLWIPQDPAGISKQEIAHSSKVIPITDEGCTLDEKTNRINWDQDASRPPIWEEKVEY